MKKMTAFFFLLALLTLALTACGNDNSNKVTLTCVKNNSGDIVCCDESGKYPTCTFNPTGKEAGDTLTIEVTPTATPTTTPKDCQVGLVGALEGKCNP